MCHTPPPAPASALSPDKRPKQTFTLWSKLFCDNQIYNHAFIITLYIAARPSGPGVITRLRHARTHSLEMFFGSYKLTRQTVKLDFCIIKFMKYLFGFMRVPVGGIGVVVVHADFKLFGHSYKFTNSTRPGVLRSACKQCCNRE